MEGVVLCSRTNNSCVRHKIEFVDFSSDVVAFKERASQILELPSGEFELLYCGLSLSDNRKLDYYGIKPGSTVHAIKKTANKDQKIESIGTDKLKQLRRAAVSIIAHKSQRHILEEILKNEDYLEKMIAVTPGLSKDVLALGLVQDIEMFILAASNDRDTLSKIVEAHPAFGHAALHVIATINEETARARPDQPSHSGAVADTAQAYALDRPSDDEDDDEEDMDLNDMNLNPGANQAGQGNAASVITSDFFQRAMMMAAGGTLNPPAPVVNQTQLDQLRDMGITDEAVARRALEQSGGDINLALEMIFGDGI